MNKFHEIEIEKLYDVILTAENFRLQIGIFFATINLGALSIALTQEKSAIFFFGAILVLIMVPADLMVRQRLVSAYYRVAYLHKKYTKNDNDYSPNWFSGLSRDALRILDLPKNQDRNAELKSSPWRIRNFIGFWFPIFVSLGETIVGIILWRLLGWTLF